jgi:hypothetical protein
MTSPIKAVGDYHPPYFFLANGLLSLYPVSVAGALNGLATAQVGLAAGLGSFDGFRECFTGLLIDTNGIKIRQRVDGTAGSTVVEVYRLRAAVWTLLGSVTLAFGGGGGASAAMTPASVALRTLLMDDVLVAVMVAAQTNGEELTASVSYT